jgi:hypothetical protein
MSVSAKPTRQERQEVQAQDKAALLKYRWSQAALAIYRDDNCCAVCWFLLGKRTVRSDVHHVFSRGKIAGDWREQYVNLLCVCRKHHPLPIQYPGANPRLAWVEEVLRQANENPINPRFKPPDDVWDE